MRTPLEKNDHPELDDTELLDEESIQHYLTTPMASDSGEI